MRRCRCLVVKKTRRGKKSCGSSFLARTDATGGGDNVSPFAIEIGRARIFFSCLPAGATEGEPCQYFVEVDWLPPMPPVAARTKQLFYPRRHAAGCPYLHRPPPHARQTAC